MKKLTYNFKSGYNMLGEVHSSLPKCQLGQYTPSFAIQYMAQFIL